LPFFIQSIMESEIITYFSWFVGGAVTYKVLSYLLAVGTAINIYNATLNGCIVMLKKIDEQKLISLSRHHLEMEKNGASEKEIQEQKNIDIKNHYLWREAMINIIIVSCPKTIKSSLTFKDWKSAMKLLDKK